MAWADAMDVAERTTQAPGGLESRIQHSPTVLCYRVQAIIYQNSCA